jgi:glycosyltransferase involved in cell wall biosynthesis
MARLLFKALAAAGFAPDLASELRTHDKAGDRIVQEALKVQSEAEAARLIRAYRSRPVSARPRLWFTYHVYYKAPDWIGPRVADALEIPYAVAEGSRAAKRARGAWALGHQGAEAALDRADTLFAMTATDREALALRRPPHQRLLDLPPFIDASELPKEMPTRIKGPAPRLLAVAMMRDGDKLASYRLLAKSLTQLRDRAWTLDVVGDGEAREDVERLLAPFGDRTTFHGSVPDAAALRRHYTAADLLVWPAVNEAYGMVLLEAQACGCPVVAGAYGGVPSVVMDGRTGVLTPPGDTTAFAGAVRGLLDDPHRLAAMGLAAQTFVHGERSLLSAAERLRTGLLPLLDRSAA